MAIDWPVGWTQCLVPHPSGPRCILYLGHPGSHRYWRASKAGLDYDTGHHRLEWGTHNDGYVVGSEGS